MKMTEKYKILGKFIKDMSSETPDTETYIFVRDYISKYQLNIDINSKALKNKMIEVNTILKFEDKQENKKKSYLSNIKDDSITKLYEYKFNAYSNFKHIKYCDIIIICVPTPLQKNKIPDTSFIEKSFESSLKYIKENCLIILESTSYPGTTQELIVKKISKKFNVGENVFVCFSPERINPGRNENSLGKIPKIVSGKTNNCLIMIKSFYGLIFKKICDVPNLETAEFTKLLENIYRSVNIGFANEMKFLAQKLNIDILDVINAAKTKPYGFRPFMPGPGIGGHCIPIDPYFLSWRMKKEGVKPEFIELSGLVNEQNHKRIVVKLRNYIKQFNVKKVLIIGIAYKKDVDDTRESASIKIIKEIKKNKNIKIYVYDNYVNFYNKKLIKNKINKLNFAKNYFDCTILLTDHSLVDYKKIFDISKKIFDTRFVYKRKDEKIERI